MTSFLASVFLILRLPMPHRNLTLLLATVALSLLCYWRGEQDPFARYVLEGYEKIDRLALDDVPDQELFEGAMAGMVDVLHRRGDHYSHFSPRQDTKRFREEHSQEIAGIGVRLGFQGESEGLTIMGPPLPGRPADRAGILQGDRILVIDQVATDQFTRGDMRKILDLMRGRPGESIELTLLRKGETEPRRVSLAREKMMLDTVRGDRLLADHSWDYLLEADRRIALVRVSSFGTKTVGELKQQLPRLVEAEAEAMILDLRGNPGGSLEAAVETCELFLPAGKLVVETRYRYGVSRKLSFSGADGPYLDLPLVVLIDRLSASASEIVAGCLQDHGRAMVVGERSFGKGTVQEVLPMQAGESLLKLTRASFWRPSGKNIHRSSAHRKQADGGWGVTPDAGGVVKMEEEAYVAWFRSRNDRDLRVQDPENDDPPAELYTDEVVDRAVAALQAKLDEGPAGKLNSAVTDDGH